MRTTISLSLETKKRLNKHGKFGEKHEDILIRLLNFYEEHELNIPSDALHFQAHGDSLEDLEDFTINITLPPVDMGCFKDIKVTNGANTINYDYSLFKEGKKNKLTIKVPLLPKNKILDIYVWNIKW